MSLKSELLRGNKRIEQAAQQPPSIKPLPSIEDPDAVTRIQRALQTLGHLPKDFGGLGATETFGIYGARTTTAVQVFQKTAFPNTPKEWDGIVGKGTLAKLDARLLSPSPSPNPQPAPVGIRVSVVPDKTGSWIGESHDVVVPSTVPGRSALAGTSAAVSFSRRLYRVEGTSINWFGVALPKTLGQAPEPLLYFTPTPYQGGAHDPQYNAWGQKWDDLFGTYIYYMGAQLAASGAQLALVIPFYRNALMHDLGSFNSDWREVIAAVVGAALDEELASAPMALVRDRYAFDSIYTASFSNGWHAHSAFRAKAIGAAQATKYAINLDGAAAKPSSANWRPANGVSYDNAGPGRAANPAGSIYHLGGRWDQLARRKGRYADFRAHWAVNQFMLYHALWQYAT